MDILINTLLIKKLSAFSLFALSIFKLEINQTIKDLTILIVLTHKELSIKVFTFVLYLLVNAS